MNYEQLRTAVAQRVNTFVAISPKFGFGPNTEIRTPDLASSGSPPSAWYVWELEPEVGNPSTFDGTHEYDGEVAFTFYTELQGDTFRIEEAIREMAGIFKNYTQSGLTFLGSRAGASFDTDTWHARRWFARYRRTE